MPKSSALSPVRHQVRLRVAFGRWFCVGGVFLFLQFASGFGVLDDAIKSPIISSDYIHEALWLAHTQMF
jgi:hypothetical protein